MTCNNYLCMHSYQCVQQLYSCITYTLKETSIRWNLIQNSIFQKKNKSFQTETETTKRTVIFTVLSLVPHFNCRCCTPLNTRVQQITRGSRSDQVRLMRTQGSVRVLNSESRTTGNFSNKKGYAYYH